jgi:DNA-binding HxlR family transcriptional regulator
MFECPVDAGLALIAGKWKPRILWKLYRYQTIRFAQFKRMMPDVTDKMLAQQLRELEADGLITRKVYPVVPPKVEYTLSSFGRTLEPVIAAIAHWGETYEPKIRSHLESQDASTLQVSS